LGRSYQKTNVFLPLRVWENLLLAAQAKDAYAPYNPLSWWGRTERNPVVVARAERALQMSGLLAWKNTTAAMLSHGIQRQLEIAMVLATEPEVLLLDEPLAGMGAAEAETMIQLLHTLKKDACHVVGRARYGRGICPGKRVDSDGEWHCDCQWHT
jgi:branched-chain amino acid transport system ATP-binding protein